MTDVIILTGLYGYESMHAIGAEMISSSHAKKSLLNSSA